MRTRSDSEEYLNFIIAKTKVRGKDKIEKIKFLVSRWNKVVADAAKSSDESDYRKGFADTHSIYADIFSTICENEDWFDIDESMSVALENLRSDYFGACDHGALDANAYLIAELEAVANV